MGNQDLSNNNTNDNKNKNKLTRKAHRSAAGNQKGTARTNDLLTLVVRPEPTDRVTHLAHPGSGDAIEEAADAGGTDCFLDGCNHAFVS